MHSSKHRYNKRHMREMSLIDSIIDEHLTGGNVNESISDLSTKILGNVENGLYRIPVVGKVLKQVGDHAVEIINKVFNIHSKLLPSAMLKEQGIDLYEWNRTLSDDELHFFGHDTITPEDQELFQSYTSSKAFTAHDNTYFKKYNDWLHSVGILPPNLTSDIALQMKYQPYMHWLSIQSALTDAHEQLGSINVKIYEKAQQEQDETM